MNKVVKRKDGFLESLNVFYQKDYTNFPIEEVVDQLEFYPELIVDIDIYLSSIAQDRWALGLHHLEFKDCKLKYKKIEFTERFWELRSYYKAVKGEDGHFKTKGFPNTKKYESSYGPFSVGDIKKDLSDVEYFSFDPDFMYEIALRVIQYVHPDDGNFIIDKIVEIAEIGFGYEICMKKNFSEAGMNEFINKHFTNAFEENDVELIKQYVRYKNPIYSDYMRDLNLRFQKTNEGRDKVLKLIEGMDEKTKNKYFKTEIEIEKFLWGCNGSTEKINEIYNENWFVDLLLDNEIIFRNIIDVFPVSFLNIILNNHVSVSNVDLIRFLIANGAVATSPRIVNMIQHITLLNI